MIIIMIIDYNFWKWSRNAELSKQDKKEVENFGNDRVRQSFPSDKKEVEIKIEKNRRKLFITVIWTFMSIEIFNNIFIVIFLISIA